MGKSPRPRILSHLRGLIKFVCSGRIIPTLKGTLAYTLAIALILIRKYDDLSSYALALSSMIIVTIAGGPGKPMGACIQSLALAMAGVLLGCGFFAILALLSPVPVAQAIIFALVVYVMSVIRSCGQRWFPFALLCILVSFNGIYTSMLSDSTFSPMYLLEYLKSYSWGAAIVLAVNVLVFPRTSERELRQTIVTSLEHLATFAALIGKAYTLSGTKEDKEARDLLSQTIKADFTFLTQQIEETSVEINWSKYSMHDYQRFTDHIRTLQRTLITAHVSLLRFDEKDVEVFRDDILPPTKLVFLRLRRDIDLTIREIGSSLGCGPMFIEATQSGYLECLDQQRAAALAGQGQSLRRSSSRKTTSGKERTNEGEDSHERTRDNVAEDLFNVSKRLQQELGAETPAQTITRPGTPTQVGTSVGTRTAIGTAGNGAQDKGSPISPRTPVHPAAAPAASSDPKPSKKKYGPKMIKSHFEEFEATQKEILIEILTSSDPGEDAILKINEPGPSVHELYGGDYLRGDLEEGDLPALIAKRRKMAKRSTPMSTRPSSVRHLTPTHEEAPPETPIADGDEGSDGSEDDDDHSSVVGPTPQFKRNETLVRVYSLLFAWDGFVENLSSFHAEAHETRNARLHFHVYENLVRPGRKGKPDIGMDDDDEQLLEEARELSIKEALALLEKKSFSPAKTTLLQKIGIFNQKLSSDTSVFAFKGAAAASVFVALLFAENTRQWFINYGLTSGLLTCIVALAPTLGQSLRTFIFQICGSGFGTLAGLTILYIFRGVGGYAYNPYGMCALLGCLAIPLQYCIYEKPQLFVLAFLSLNSVASIILIVYINVDYYGHTTYDSPALRAGKALASLAVALAIVITFQLFVLRNPARRTLRKAISKLVYSNLAYNTILQAYVRSVMPADPRHRGKPAVLKRIERELKHREAKMQLQIVDLGPLMAYASVEPSFSKTFQGELIQDIIQANQIILDRLREARAAIGMEPFDPVILENMVAVLSPYRRRSARIIKIGLYLCASSLMSKSPLPHDSDFSQVLLNQFIHDALLLSSRLTRTEEGAQAIRGDSFTRYWFYIISVSGIQTQIRLIDVACKKIFGELEDDPQLQ